MQRRQFGKWAGLAPLVLSPRSFANNFRQNAVDIVSRLNPLIQPQERVERRVYASSSPQKYVWHTAPYRYSYPPRVAERTVGFVEGVSTRDRLLYIPGILIRRDLQRTSSAGLDLLIATDLAWLSLPRRTSKAPDVIQERYAFDEQYSVNASEYIDPISVSIDLRRIVISENGHSYTPNQEVAFENKLNAMGSFDQSANLRPLSGPTVRMLGVGGIRIEHVVFFDIPLRPLRFKVELPPLIIQDVEVPLPTCFFEPFNIQTNKWVDG